jgi:preprotein translocase subunit SecG
MMCLPLASWIGSMFTYIVMTLFIFICIILIILVLIQKGRGGGLSGAFGGGGGGTAFGAKTGDVLTWATSVVFGIFLLLAILMTLLTNHGSKPVNSGGATGGPANSLPQPTNPAR